MDELTKHVKTCELDLKKKLVNFGSILMEVLWRFEDKLCNFKKVESLASQNQAHQ
jgi:hypothetical protein